MRRCAKCIVKMLCGFKVSNSGINKTLTYTPLSSHHLSVIFLLVNINNNEKMLALKLFNGTL